MVEQHAETAQPTDTRAENQSGGDAAAFLFADIKRHVALPPNISPQHAIRSVMCTFSQHLSGGEARHLWKTLPEAIKPLLDRCMVHRTERAESFTKDQLLLRVAEHLGVPIDRAAAVTAAVLTAISSRVPAKEMADVASQLPAELRDLWIVKKVPLAPPVEPHPILSRIERSVALPAGVTGLGAFTSVLCHFSHRLSLGEARHLFRALPADLRQLIEPCLQGRGEPPERFDKTELLERLAKALHTDRAQAETIVRKVFYHVEEYIPADVFEHVMSQLPRTLSDLWALPERP